MIAAIVAVDNNWGIGFNGSLLEPIPADLKRFKKLTENKIVIMGRKTWDSLPKKPLPDRLNIVISREPKAVITESVIRMGLDEIKTRLSTATDNENWFIIGGGEIYKELLPFCDTLYITKIYKEHKNVDTYFPNIDNLTNWNLFEESEINTHKDFHYQYLVYKRFI